MKTRITLTLLAFVTLLPVTGLAQFGGLKVPVGQKPASETPADAPSAEAMQEELVQKFTAGDALIMEANRNFLEALLGKEEAAKYFVDAQAISGEDLSKGGIEKRIQVTEAATAKVREQLALGEALSAEAKVQFAQGLLPYALGIQQTAQLSSAGKNFGNSAQNEIKSAGMMNAAKVRGKLEGGLYVVTKLPGYLNNLRSSTVSIFDFARDQGVEIPPDATAALDF